MVAESPLLQNAYDLEHELDWFDALVAARCNYDLFPEGRDTDELCVPAPPDLSGSTSPYARFVTDHQLTLYERTALILGLAPHLRPKVLDVFFAKNPYVERPFTEFGGLRTGTDGSFIPTGETLAFIIGGHDLATRFILTQLFSRDHMFAQHDILRLVPNHSDQPLLQAPLQISDEYLSQFTTGQPIRPDVGLDFPARYIETALDWDDLVLHPGTRNQLDEIETWLRHGDTLMHDWGMAAKLRPGYRSLFYGPPGTGKTMTASLLGKTYGREVYKIDLSLVVSKYIGETEKNLAQVFDRAQAKGWILFFDEADALFGKRSETQSAHDRYANQEVAYLLQRIETFDGIAILASNLRDNLDPAFTRRFESMIYFPMPRAEERLLLWQQGFSSAVKLDDQLDLSQLAKDHELAGGSIINVIRYASLQALSSGASEITRDDVQQGIRREYAKEGRTG